MKIDRMFLSHHTGGATMFSSSACMTTTVIPLSVTDSCLSPWSHNTA